MANELILKVFGDNLRKFRLEKGWTQKDLAFEVNMEPTYISKIELGKTNPSLLMIDMLAGALGVRPSELLQ